MSNNISFVGRLGSDPELKNVGSNSILEMNVANSTGFGDKKITNWFRCDLWGSRGEKIQQYLSKGKQVFITGELSFRKYTNNDGVEKMSPEVTVSQIDFINEGGNNNNQNNAPAQDNTEVDLPF